MIQNFKKKYQSLPATVLPYFETEAATDANVYIIEKYVLTAEQEGAFMDILSQLFFRDIALKDLVPSIVSLLGFERERAAALARDIAGIKLMPIKDWLGEDVAGYIRALGGTPESYAPFIKELDETIEKELSEAKAAEAELDEPTSEAADKDMAELNSVSDAPAEVKFDIEREKRDSVEIFKGKLRDFFGIYDHPFLAIYNEVLIEALKGDQNFKKSLEDSLYANDEVLTRQSIDLDGRQVAPTIANWLKVFIKTVGTDYFNDLRLTDFIVNSPNAKILNEEERLYLKRLLFLYRNLRFFPHGFANHPETDWEIIPYERNIEQMERNVEPPRSIKSPEEINIINLRKTGQGLPANSLAHDAVNEEIERQQKIEGLKIMAAKHQFGSLERRAIEGEIKKLEI